MTDAFLDWRGDFMPDSTGGLRMIDGDEEVRQRLQRRLFTAVKGYVWHPEYGAGLPQKIGSLLSVEQIKSVVRSQLAMEASVAPFPPAVLSVGTAPNRPDMIVIGIQYYDNKASRTVSFSITA